MDANARVKGGLGQRHVPRVRVGLVWWEGCERMDGKFPEQKRIWVAAAVGGMVISNGRVQRAGAGPSDAIEALRPLIEAHGSETDRLHFKLLDHKVTRWGLCRAM
jgi:hypothetical protein